MVAVVALVAGVAVGYALGSNDDDVATDTTTSSTLIQPGGGPTTTARPDDKGDATPPDDALWPDGDDDAKAAAGDFIVGVFGDVNHALGPFKEETDEAGTIDAFSTGESGDARILVSTLTMRRNEGEWFVVGAQSEGIVLDKPARLAAVTSPLTVSGRGRGFEGTIIIELQSRGDDDPVTLERTDAQGGSTAELEPFTTDISFDAARLDAGTLVVSASTGLENALTEFTALPVTFG